MQIIALVGDAFGGHGGIAKFNRDLLTDLTTHPEVEGVIALPRIISDEIGSVPEKLDYRVSAANNRGRYALEVLRTGLKARRNRKKPLILCGHIHLLPFAFAVRALTRGKVVLMIHGIEAWRPLPRALPNFLAKHIRSFISVSELTAARFRSWTGLSETRQHILPNCIDLERFTPGPKNPDLIKRYGLENARVIMTLGRMAAKERYKGFDEVLEVLPGLIGSIPNLKYLLVGDGTDRSRLEQKARDLQIGDRVVFTGKVSEDEKVDHYRLADAFVMPGSGEGFGIVYLEAMGCGLPVVGSKIDGSPAALLGGELGSLVDPTNARDVEMSILTLLTCRSHKAMQELQHFSRPRYTQRLHLILDEICPRLV